MIQEKNNNSTKEAKMKKGEQCLYNGWNFIIKTQTVPKCNLKIVEIEAQLIPIPDKYMTTHFPCLVQILW